MVEYPQGDLFIPVHYIRNVVLEHLEFDGIFAISDQLAYEVLKILQEAQRKVPHDIKLCGYDGIKATTNFGLSLTTIEQPVVDLAKAMVTSLLNQINKMESPDMILPVRLQLGDTT
jgi:DNA-binding LacI/PurR family transcriptional regulator